MVPHLTRNHHKYPYLCAMCGMHEYVYEISCYSSTCRTHHGCYSPVASVVKNMKILSLEVANDRSNNDDRNPDHEQSVVGGTHH